MQQPQVNYTLGILPRVQGELAKLPSDTMQRVRDAIVALAPDPRPHGCLKLTGRDGWRIRIGDYRVIYEIDDTRRTVTILHVGHRRESIVEAFEVDPL